MTCWTPSASPTRGKNVRIAPFVPFTKTSALPGSPQLAHCSATKVAPRWPTATMPFVSTAYLPLAVRVPKEAAPQSPVHCAKRVPATSQASVMPKSTTCFETYELRRVGAPPVTGRSHMLLLVRRVEGSAGLGPRSSSQRASTRAASHQRTGVHVSVPDGRGIAVLVEPSEEIRHRPLWLTTA